VRSRLKSLPVSVSESRQATWARHGDLARQCDLRLAPAQAVQLVVGDAEDLYDRLLDRLARRSKGASATGKAMRADR
jgi:hypothetical protein